MHPETKNALDELRTTWESYVKPRIEEQSQRIDDLEVRLQKSALDTRGGGVKVATNPDILAPGESMALSRKHRHSTPADDFRLGRVVAALAAPDMAKHLSDTERKALGEGVGSEGGFVVGEEYATSVLDRVRNATRVIQAGARTLPMEESVLHLPRMDDGVEPTWRAENTAVTEDAPTFSRVTLMPRTCAVLVKMSVELLQDASPAAISLIERELTEAIGLKLDYAALYGAGTDSEPLGIKNVSGVDLDELGSGNGATPTSWDDVVNAVAAIRGRNHEPTGYLWNSTTDAVFGKYKDSTNQPLNPPPYLAGMRGYVTNQIPNNQTVGSSTDCSDIFVGDWSQLLIGVRPSLGVRVMRLNEVFMGSLQVGIVAWVRADVALARTAAFTVITGVRD